AQWPWWSITPLAAARARRGYAWRTSLRYRSGPPRACATSWDTWCCSMAIRTVLRMGDPRLLTPSQPGERFDTGELQTLIADMDDTMRSLNGAGLAAPQIGVLLQVAIFGVEANPRYPDAEPVPYTVLINPRLTPVGREMEDGWEGCLSVPGMRGLVPRYRHLRYHGSAP